jgi:hypothetical protein
MQLPTLRHTSSDDIKIYRAIKSPQNCNKLQSDVNSMQRWWTANCTKLSISKTKVISFSRKTNVLIYVYKFYQSSITWDLGIFNDTKCRFHNHVNHILLVVLSCWDLVSSITFTFSSVECTHTLYITLLISRLELRQLMLRSWNDSSRGLQPSTWIFSFHKSLTSEEVKSHTLRMRRHRLDVLFLIKIYLGFKICPSVLEIVGLRVPARYSRDFASFNVCSSYKNCPSARCASAANVVCRDVDVFGAENVLINQFFNMLYCYYYYYYFIHVYMNIMLSLRIMAWPL